MARRVAGSENRLMPTWLIDYDALWSSDRLKQCREDFRHEYTWLHGLAAAGGTFELSIDSIRSRILVLRPKLTQAKETTRAQASRSGSGR